MKDKIEKLIKQYVDERNHSDLNISTTKFGISVKIFSSVLLRIYTDRKSTYRIELIKNNELDEYFSKNNKAIKKDGVYQIDINKNDDILISTLKDLEEPIKIQTTRILSNIKVDSFGCCSHYIECSDAKKCIMSDVDKDFYRGCQYREKLESGRIFYGKNANISK